MKAVLIPGDGIGREIAESVREVSAALNTGIEWQEFAAGAEYAAESGELIAPGTLDAIEACGWALKGPTATPIGKGFRSINVQLRQRFSTYANLRPVHTLPGVPTRFDNVDLVIVRENTEDLYAGIEFDEGAAEVEELSQLVERSGQKTFAADSAISIKPISIAKSRRIDVILHCGRHTKFLFHDLLYRHACVSRNIAVRIKNASIFRIHFPGSADPDRFKIVIGMD